MTPAIGNEPRFDPYRNFKFRVKWEGREVAGFSKVSVLQSPTEVIEYREGGDPSTLRKAPSHAKLEAITLERGITYDREFVQWANQVRNPGAGPGAETLLKDLLIELYNEAGQLALAYIVFRCWVPEFQALPDLDANANAVAIERLKLEHEGWTRDGELAEPAAPEP